MIHFPEHLDFVEQTLALQLVLHNGLLVEHLDRVLLAILLALDQKNLGKIALAQHRLALEITTELGQNAVGLEVLEPHGHDGLIFMEKFFVSFFFDELEAEVGLALDLGAAGHFHEGVADVHEGDGALALVFLAEDVVVLEFEEVAVVVFLCGRGADVEVTAEEHGARLRDRLLVHALQENVFDVLFEQSALRLLHFMISI